MSANEQEWQEPRMLISTDSMLAYEWLVWIRDCELYRAGFDKKEHAKRAVDCVTACAGMSNPEQEIQSMREAIRFIAQQPCYGDTGDFSTCFDVSPSLCVTEYCLACYAKAASRVTP